MGARLSANFSVYRQDFNQDVLQKRLICFVEGCTLTANEHHGVRFCPMDGNSE
jgi:hypothetical protein